MFLNEFRTISKTVLAKSGGRPPPPCPPLPAPLDAVIVYPRHILFYDQRAPCIYFCEERSSRTVEREKIIKVNVIYVIYNVIYYMDFIIYYWERDWAPPSELYVYIYGTLTPSHKSGKKSGKVSGLYAVCRSACIMYTYVTCNNTVRLVNCQNNCKRTV